MIYNSLNASTKESVILHEYNRSDKASSRNGKRQN